MKRGTVTVTAQIDRFMQQWHVPNCFWTCGYWETMHDLADTNDDMFAAETSDLLGQLQATQHDMLRDLTYIAVLRAGIQGRIQHIQHQQREMQRRKQESMSPLTFDLHSDYIYPENRSVRAL